jgi:hypothetical protein
MHPYPDGVDHICHMVGSVALDGAEPRLEGGSSDEPEKLPGNTILRVAGWRRKSPSGLEPNEPFIDDRRSPGKIGLSGDKRPYASRPSQY